MTEPTPAPTTPPVPVEVLIDTPGPTIHVKAAEPLDLVAAKALEMYKTVVADWPERPPKDLGGGTGFHTERSW